MDNERLAIDVNKLPLVTYGELIMLRAVFNVDTLEQVITILANDFFKDQTNEREDN